LGERCEEAGVVRFRRLRPGRRPPGIDGQNELGVGSATKGIRGEVVFGGGKEWYVEVGNKV